VSGGERFLRSPEFRTGPFPRRRGRRLLLAAGTAGAALLLVARLLIFRSPRGRVEPGVPGGTRLFFRAAAPPPPPPEVIVIPAGATLSALLARHGFSAEESYVLWREVRPVFDMQTLIAGRELRLSKDAAGMVQTIDYDLDDRRHLQIERVGKRFLPGIVNYLFETRVAYAAGAI